jgi:ADP-ribose pyrophosphatase
MDLYRGKRMRVEKTRVKLPSGNTKERVVVRPGNAVAMLPIEGDFCYLIRQYRYPIDRYICEAPAGTIDEDEKPRETARRELIEEIGMEAETLIARGYIYTTPGFTDEVIYLFEARGLSPSLEYEKDEDEVIEVDKIRLADVEAMIRDGRIVDAKTISLAYLCLR